MTRYAQFTEWTIRHYVLTYWLARSGLLVPLAKMIGG